MQRLLSILEVMTWKQRAVAALMLSPLLIPTIAIVMRLVGGGAQLAPLGNPNTQPVGAGVNWACQDSAPSPSPSPSPSPGGPSPSPRTWVRCSDDQLMHTTAQNVDVPSMGGTLLTSDAAITRYMIVKASTVASRVTPLAAGDSSVLLAGVALNAATSSGLPVVVSVPGFPTLLLNDGTGAIAPGDIIEPSPTLSGYAHEGSTDPVCVAMTSAAASVGATFLCR